MCFYPVYSLAANLTKPFYDKLPEIVSFKVDINYIPEGEDDKCQIDVLMHSDKNVFIYCWKTYDENWKVLYLRHQRLTWKMRICQGNVFTFDYDIKNKSMICHQSIMDKIVGWPQEKYELDQTIDDLLNNTKNKELKIPTHVHKWMLKSSKQYLFELGFDMDYKTKEGKSLLHHAAMISDRGYLECFLPKFNSVNIADSDNVTPLHEACLSGNIEVAKMLLDKQADANARIKSSGLTSLMIIAKQPEQNVKFIRLLLKYNAYCDMEDNNGMRAVDYARQVNPKSPIINLIHPILSQI